MENKIIINRIKFVLLLILIQLVVMVAETLEALLDLSWADMVKEIPNPPQKKKDSVRARRGSIAAPKPRRVRHEEVESTVSFAQQKMNMYVKIMHLM